MLSLKTEEFSSARDVIRSVCREIRLSFSQYCGQFWIRGSRIRSHLLRLYLPLQPRRERRHATAPEYTRSSQANPQTTAQVSHPSLGTLADASGPCHLSQSEPLQPLS